MRSGSNFIRLSTSLFVTVLLVAIGIGATGNRVASVSAAQATMAGTMEAVKCPAGSAMMTPAMMATMSAMMGTEAAMMGTKPAMMGTEAAMTGTMSAMAATMTAADMSAEMAGAGCVFSVALTGAAEVPGPGDTKGSGTTTVLVNAPKHAVCYEFKVTGIKLPAAAAHIHKAEAGKAGGVVIPFAKAPGADGTSRGCVINVPNELVTDLLANPANYYVNVHTSDFAAGAIRGQLVKK